jgi:hypothetical protein
MKNINKKATTFSSGSTRTHWLMSARTHACVTAALVMHAAFKRLADRSHT